MSKSLKEVGDSKPASESPAVLAPRPPDHCANCGARLHGPVCHQCGQKAHSPLRHLGALIEDVADSFFDFDNRLFRTLPALYLRPGFLTGEYFAGRRVRYLPPFRATFLLSVLAFLVIQFSVDDSVLKIDATGGNIFAAAATPTEVRQMLDKQLAELDKADQQVGSAAAAGIDAARTELRQQAATRIRALSGPTAQGAVASPEATVAEWLDRIGHAESLARVQELTPQALAAVDGLQTATTGTTSTQSSALKSRIYQAAGERVAVLAGRAEADKSRIRAEVSPGLLNAFGQFYASRAKANLMQLRDDPQARQRMVGAMFNVSPAVLLAMLPVFAVLLKFMYLFKRRLYVEHLIVALHSHAFIFLSLLLLALAGLARGALAPVAAWTQTPMLWLMWGLGLWIPLYLLLMQKRIYQQGWIMTLGKYAVLGLAYSMLLAFALVAVVLTALGSM